MSAVERISVSVIRRLGKLEWRNTLHYSALRANMTPEHFIEEEVKRFCQRFSLDGDGKVTDYFRKALQKAIEFGMEANAQVGYEMGAAQERERIIPSTAKAARSLSYARNRARHQAHT